MSGSGGSPAAGGAGSARGHGLRRSGSEQVQGVGWMVEGVVGRCVGTVEMSPGDGHAVRAGGGGSLQIDGCVAEVEELVRQGVESAGGFQESVRGGFCVRDLVPADEDVDLDVGGRQERACGAGACPGEDRDGVIERAQSVEAFADALVGADRDVTESLVVALRFAGTQGSAQQVVEDGLRYSKGVGGDNACPVERGPAEVGHCPDEGVRHDLRGVEDRAVHVPDNAYVGRHGSVHPDEATFENRTVRPRPQTGAPSWE